MIRTLRKPIGEESGKPRASGDDPGGVGYDQDTREVNPARAGMILRMRARGESLMGKPRASGDDPSTNPRSAYA